MVDLLCASYRTSFASPASQTSSNLCIKRTRHWRRGQVRHKMSFNENGASNAIPKFDCHSDPATLGPRWTRWLTSFELFADGKGLIIAEATNATTRQRRRAMLLHLAGPDVQVIFSTLADTGEATDYAATVTALNGYFLPKVNAAFTRQKFHRLQQKESETVLQFVTRLRKEGKDCNFGADFDNQIRDAVLCKCRSDYVRRRLLEERVELTLAPTLEIAEGGEGETTKCLISE